MQDHQDRIVAALMEQLIETGPEGMAHVFTALFNLAMRLEREQHLGAGLHERSEGRRGYANGYKPKIVDTPAGSLSLRVPKSRDCDEPFFPQSLERGRRSSRAVMLAIAQMYVQGVSTRDAAKVMAEFGLESLSSTQVSRAAALLDEELEAWRTRELEQVCYLVLDARYEKVRDCGVVRDAAILTAVGVSPEGRRRILGVSVALSEAEVHWRAFLDSLIERGMRGVEFVVSDDHAGLRAARRAVLPGATWQRCQFHLAQNAIHHAPNLAIRKQIGGELRAVWNARDLQAAEAELRRLVDSYAEKAPKLAGWLETNISEGLAVFSLPEHHRRRMRTSNPIERAVQQEIKRRTQKVRIFPTEPSLLRLVTAVLAEIDEEWATTDRVYINMEDRNG
jgi:transposase-like protein